MRFIIEIVTHHAGVVAQEINRFAHFGDGVVIGFARFAHQNADQLLHAVFHILRGAIEDRRALVRRRRKPDWSGVHRRIQRQRHFRFAGFAHLADDIARRGRIDDRTGFAVAQLAVDNRLRQPGLRGAAQQGAGERRQTMFVGHIDARRVAASRAVEIARQRDLRMRQANRPFARAQFFHCRHRIGHQLVNRQRGIGDTVNERGIGAVFQQATHQVGEQGFMSAHRRIDAARTIELAVRHFTDHLLIERFAHAVQALELILARIVVIARQLIDGRQRMGVVSSELRIDQVWHRQQLARAGEVRDVGVDLAGIDRIAFEAFHLGAFDFAVPVGAFHQADHQAATAALRQIDQRVDHERATLHIGLDHEADAVPALQLRLKAELLQQIERQLEAIRLFGVDIDADVVRARQQRQRFQNRVELLHHAIVLRAAVARVQGGKLDRDAGAFINAAAVRGFADSVDRLLVGDQVGFGVAGGQRRFAQHIVGVAEAFLFQLARVGQRLGDGFAGNKLFAHQAHRHIDAFAHQRLAALADNTVQRARQISFVVRRDQTSGKQQTPGGGVNEQGRAAAQMRLPVAVADFVADQRVARRLIGNAQQRFRQAHQRYALLRGERELLQQALHHAGASGCPFLVPQLVGEAVGELMGFLRQRRRQTRLLQQHRHRVGLGTTPGGGNRGARHRLRQNMLGEIEEGLMRLFRGDLFLLYLRARRHGDLRQGVAALQLAEVVENRLLNQPVRRAVNLLRRQFNAFAGGLIQLHPHRCRAHDLSAPVFNSHTAWPALSLMLQLCATVLSVTCLTAFLMINLLTLQKAAWNLLQESRHNCATLTHCTVGGLPGCNCGTVSECNLLTKFSD